jgi:glutaredoxin
LIKLIGTKNCSRCAIIKNILTQKKIDFEYYLFDDLNSELQNQYMKMANKKNIISFPIIIKENNIVGIEDLQ